MRVVSEVVWDNDPKNFHQWTFTVDDERKVLTVYNITNLSDEPGRANSWKLIPEMYVEFLDMLLRRYHNYYVESYKDVSRTIIAVQNEFAKAILKERKDS